MSIGSFGDHLHINFDSFVITKYWVDPCARADFYLVGI